MWHILYEGPNCHFSIGSRFEVNTSSKEENLGTIKSDITCLVVSLVWDVLELEIQLSFITE